MKWLRSEADVGFETNVNFVEKEFKSGYCHSISGVRKFTVLISRE